MVLFRRYNRRRMVWQLHSMIVVPENNFTLTTLALVIFQPLIAMISRAIAYCMNVLCKFLERKQYNVHLLLTMFSSPTFLFTGRCQSHSNAGCDRLLTWLAFISKKPCASNARRQFSVKNLVVLMVPLICLLTDLRWNVQVISYLRRVLEIIFTSRTNLQCGIVRSLLSNCNKWYTLAIAPTPKINQVILPDEQQRCLWLQFTQTFVFNVAIANQSFSQGCVVGYFAIFPLIIMYINDQPQGCKFMYLTRSNFYMDCIHWKLHTLIHKNNNFKQGSQSTDNQSTASSAKCNFDGGTRNTCNRRHYMTNTEG